MNGRTAKSIRKSVYADSSKRNTYTYDRRIRQRTNQLVCIGLHSLYLAAKSYYKSVKAGRIVEVKHAR
jgi:hypothetical protein